MVCNKRLPYSDGIFHKMHFLIALRASGISGENQHLSPRSLVVHARTYT